MLGSPPDAEDVAQETLLRAWRSLDHLGRGAPVDAWLLRIATNACLDELERRPRGPGPLVEPYPDARLRDAGTPLADPLARHARGDALDLAFLTAVQRLPDRQRAVLLLRDVLGWTGAEVAALLGSTAPAVDGALERARAAIDRELPTGPPGAAGDAARAAASLRRGLGAGGPVRPGRPPAPGRGPDPAAGRRGRGRGRRRRLRRRRAAAGRGRSSRARRPPTAARPSRCASARPRARRARSGSSSSTCAASGSPRSGCAATPGSWPASASERARASDRRPLIRAGAAGTVATPLRTTLIDVTVLPTLPGPAAATCGPPSTGLDPALDAERARDGRQGAVRASAGQPARRPEPTRRAAVPVPAPAALRPAAVDALPPRLQARRGRARRRGAPPPVGVLLPLPRRPRAAARMAGLTAGARA